MKFEQNWLRGFRGGRLKMLKDRRTDNGRKVITIAMKQVFKIREKFIIQWVDPICMS